MQMMQGGIPMQGEMLEGGTAGEQGLWKKLLGMMGGSGNVSNMLLAAGSGLQSQGKGTGGGVPTAGPMGFPQLLQNGTPPMQHRRRNVNDGIDTSSIMQLLGGRGR